MVGILSTALKRKDARSARDYTSNTFPIQVQHCASFMRSAATNPSFFHTTQPVCEVLLHLNARGLIM